MIILFVLLAALLPLQEAASSIVSNIPVVVTTSKNYTSSAPTWLTSPFFRAGNEAVIRTLTGNSSTPTYTFTFSSALPGFPNLAYGIKNYRGNDWFGQEFYEIRKIGLTASTFSVAIQIYGVTNLWLLTVAYLAVDPTFPHHLNTFDNVPLNYSSGPILNITTYPTGDLTQRYFAQYINYTSQAEGRTFTKFTSPLAGNSIVLYMTSFWVRARFGSGGTLYPIKFHVYTSIINQSFYMWNATLEVQSLVTNVHFSQIIFNSNDVESSKKYFIVYAKWYNDKDGGFLSIPQEFVDNFIMGVTTFETVDGYCGFEYQWEFATQDVAGVPTFGVEMLLSWSLTGTCGFSWSESSIFYMQTWLCEAPFYYFNLTSSLCQTLCGGYNYENPDTFTCEPCDNTNCYQCAGFDKTICTTCATYLNYQLLNDTCICLDGFFEYSDNCKPCSQASTGCLTCTYNDNANGSLPYNSSLFYCTLCNQSANYFVNNRFCTLCTLSNCLLCNNLTTCLTCASGWNLSAVATCIRCYVTGCVYCSTTNANACVSCDAALGYYLNSSQNCITQCGDGIYVSAAEGCDDNNTANYDGCSSTCTLETAFTCSGSPSACYYAAAPTFTHQGTIMETAICDTITFTFALSPASATFAQPNVNWTNFLTTPNASAFTPNNSMFKYTSGSLQASFFLLQDLQNLSLTFTANFSALLPNSTIFANTASPTVTFTVLPTNNIQALMVCCTGYIINTALKKCLEICGDGILFERPCDDGNLKNGDGCSSTCTVETDYVCVNGSATTPSVCSFNGTISITLATGNKNPTSNALTLSYDISPIQPVLNLVNGTTNLAPYVSFPSTPGVTITSAVYDPTTNQVVVQVAYTSSLQGQPLNLVFDPPNLPQAALMGNLSSAWVVNPTNHLAAEVYSASDYKAVDKLTPFAKAMLGTYLGFSILTISFRKYLGLELATLMQIGYLSLLQNDRMSSFLQPISNWQYVFGYNYFYVSPAPKTAIDEPYALYDYQKYFGYSNNVMILATACFYGLGVLLVLLSTITTKSASRRMKVGGLFVINEVAYTLVVFNTANVVTAFCIEIYEGTLTEVTPVWSKAFLVLAMLLMVFGNVANFISIEDSQQIGTFFRKHTKIGIYTPFLFNLRLILLTVFIFLHQTMKSKASFALMGIQFTYIIFVAFGRPHKKPLDLARSLFLEISLFFILTTRFLDVEIIQKLVAQNESKYYEIIAYVEYAYYGVANVFSIISFIYHIGKKLRKGKISPENNPQEEGELSPDKYPNESMAKVLEDTSPSKRGRKDSNPLIFDIQELDVETHGTSTIHLDPSSPKRRPKRINK